MPLSVTTVYSGPFTPNGVTTIFPFDFKALDPAEVSVTDAQGVPIAGLDYAVEIAAEGGNVVFGDAPEAADLASFFIASLPTFEQDVEFTPVGIFNPRTLQTPFDRTAVRDAWLKDRVDRSISFPMGEPIPILPAAADRSGRFLAFDAGGGIVAASGTGADGALREDIASPTGGAMVKTSRSNTVENELTWARAAGPASINEFYDATNGAAAERMALEDALASGREVSFRGLLTLDQAIVMPTGAVLTGEGASSYDHSQGRTCILRGFAGSTTLLTMGDDCQLRNLDFDGDAVGTGDLVALKGARCVVDNVSVRKAGGDNFRIGGTMEALNANGWRISGLRSYLAEGRGFYCHHTNSNTSGTFPQGAPDVNAGVMFGGDFLRNKGDGFVIGNAIDNKFFGPFSQESEGRNFHFMEDARGNHLYGYYNEEKIGSPGSILAVGALGNMLYGSQVISPSQIVDMDGRNYVDRHSASIARAAHVGDLNLLADPSPGPNSIGDGSGGFINLFDEQLSLAAQIYAAVTGVGSRSKGVATAKADGNVPIDVFEWAPDGIGINILNGGLRVVGTKVVGAQGAAVADATDAATVITQLNALLARLRSHGLIAT